MFLTLYPLAEDNASLAPILHAEHVKPLTSSTFIVARVLTKSLNFSLFWPATKFRINTRNDMFTQLIWHYALDAWHISWKQGRCYFVNMFSCNLKGCCLLRVIFEIKLDDWCYVGTENYVYWYCCWLGLTIASVSLCRLMLLSNLAMQFVVNILVDDIHNHTHSEVWRWFFVRNRNVKL